MLSYLWVLITFPYSKLLYLNLKTPVLPVAVASSYPCKTGAFASMHKNQVEWSLIIISFTFCHSNHFPLPPVVRTHMRLRWLSLFIFMKTHLCACPFLCQATVAMQDSCYEVQKLLLQDGGRPSPHAQRPHFPSIRGSTLQEQEKQRNLEKQKEEMVAIQRLHDQLRQERERWERDCQAKESQQGEQESRLKEREKQCHLEAERLRREREELDEQLEEYQQGLERLREGQRNVERERERLENQQKLLQTWRHGRQRSLPTVIPHMVIPLDGQQVRGFLS